MGKASDFWRFSLAFYRLPGVGPACIVLQDEAGVDVNVLLYLLFLAEQRRAVSSADVALLDALVRDWRAATVIPLREMRRRLKEALGAIEPQASAALRAEVKRLELESERIEQEALERLAPAGSLGTPAASRAQAAQANLAAYASFLGAMPREQTDIVLQVFDAR